MELIDTHCHLYFDPLATDVPGVLGRARAEGVVQVVVPAYDLSSWEAMPTLVGPGVAVAYGLHPWKANQPLELDLLEQQIRSTGAVAVGEIGLDFAIPDADRRRQIDAFTEQLDLARRLDLPVILHCRRAFDAMEALLRERGPVRGVLHAFSRGPELARRLVEGLDLHLAFGGGVTRPAARRSRESVATVPARRLLLETDAPSIGLEGVPPERTEPRHVARVAAVVAELRGERPEQVAEQTTENARQLFRLS